MKKQRGNFTKNLVYSVIFTMTMAIATLAGVYAYLYAGEKNFDVVLHKYPIVVSFWVFFLSAVRVGWLIVNIPKAAE